MPLSGTVFEDSFQSPSELFAAEGIGKPLTAVTTQQRSNPPDLEGNEESACHQQTEGGRVEVHQSRTRLPTHGQTIMQDDLIRKRPMKEVSVVEMLLRSIAKVAAGSGIAALLLWLTYVMLDVQHMNTGFTLPQTTYN